jgi:NADPH:quinone reductase-like Zn-dependent oxidoreductase
MRAAVLHAFGQVPQWEEFPQPVPHDGEELIEVTAAPLNNIDRVPADGSHWPERVHRPSHDTRPTAGTVARPDRTDTGRARCRQARRRPSAPETEEMT